MPNKTYKAIALTLITCMTVSFVHASVPAEVDTLAECNKKEIKTLQDEVSKLKEVILLKEQIHLQEMHLERIQSVKFPRGTFGYSRVQLTENKLNKLHAELAQVQK